MRFISRFSLMAWVGVMGHSGIAQVDQVDRFDSPTLNPRWVTAFTTRAGGSYRQTNGALNFTVATGSTNRVENNIHVLNTNALPTDRSWTLVMGMHNSADYSTQFGSSQLQMGLGDLNPVTPRSVGFTLARSKNLNGGNPLFGFGGSDLPNWYDAGGYWTNASSNASAKFVYDATTRTLQGFVTTDGTDPITNTNYSWIPAGPASSIPVSPTAQLRFVVIQNVYSVAVPVGRMWVDNYKLSFAPLDGRLYPGLPATLSRRPGQDLFLSVSPRDQGTLTYEWRKNGQVVPPLSFGSHAYFKADLKAADTGTYSVVVKRNGTAYATSQTVLTVTNTAPGPTGSDDFSASSTRWSGLWGFDAHDSYLEANAGRLDYVLDKAGSENSQAFQLWDNRLPSSQNWEVVVDTFMEPEFSPEGYFALRLGVAAPVNPANGLAALNGLEINFANSRYGGGRKIQNIKTIPTGDGWLELGQAFLSSFTTNVALRMKWDAGTKVLTSFYDTNGATGGYVWTQSATNNLSALPAAQLTNGFYTLISGIAEPSFLLPAGQAYFKNFSVRTGPVIPVQMAPQTAAEGGSVTFTAPGEGTEPISYQWRKNGVAIDGETNATLTLSSLTGADSGQYSVFISNALGTITSSNALLTIIVPPGFPAQATNGLRGNLGVAFRYQPTVTGSAAVFTSSNLPPGLTVNRTNGLITGTPTAAGYYRSVLTASNPVGAAVLSLNFTVPGTPQTLPFTEDFSRATANRYAASSLNTLPRMVITNGALEYRSTNQTDEKSWVWPNLLLPLTNSWDVQVDARVPISWDEGEGKVAVSLLKDVNGGTYEDISPNKINLKFKVSAEEGQQFQYHFQINGEETEGATLGVTNQGLARLRFLYSSASRKLTLLGASYSGTNLSPWIQLGQESLASNEGLGQRWQLQATNNLRLILWAKSDSQDGNANGARRMALDNLSVTLVTPPRITGPTNFNGQVGVSFSNRLIGTNGQTYFTATNLPAGLTLDETNGIITGIPEAAGRFTNTRVGVGNPAAASDTPASFTILPAFTSSNAVTGYVNDAGFSHRVEVGTNNFGSNLKYAATGLPTGMSINVTNGLISGKPTVAGTFPATVTITALGASASQRVDFTVQGAAGGAFSLTLNPRPTNVLNLPAGLSYNRASGLISGTPQIWGSFTATGQMSNGTTTNISIPVMPSVPVIAGPTNWSAQVGQEARYQIVAGGAGREWAGWDGFEAAAPSTNWISSGPLAAFRTNSATKSGLSIYQGRLSLTHGGTTNQTSSGYLVWARTIPVGAKWVAMVDAGISTNLNLVRRTNSLGQSTNGQWIATKLNLLRGGSELTDPRQLSAEYVRSPEEGNLLLARTNSNGELGKLSSPSDLAGLAIRYDEMGTISSLGFPEPPVWQTLHSLSVNDWGLSSTNQWRLVLGGFSEFFLLESGAVWFDDFVVLPDPDTLMYRAYLVGTNGLVLTNESGNPYLPEGLELNSSGCIAGVPSSNLPGGNYRIRVEAEYNMAVMPLQGVPSVKGGTNVSLTLLPAFTATNAAMFLLNASNRIHTVGISTNTFGINLRFSATGLPAGLVINPTSGVISGRPTSAGTFSTRVTITAGTATAFQDLLLSVYNGEGNRWAVGNPVSYQVNFGAGVTGYQATGLPIGLTISSSGLISGTPREAGVFNVTVSVPARGLSTVIPFFIRPIYVNLAASGANNGTSWADAYTNMQTAINAAGAGSQIWVAAGTYKPTQFMDPKVTNNTRSRSFVLKGGVSVLGGFAGTETALSQRDLTNTNHLTVLSGDFLDNDSTAWPPDSTRQDNAYHVLVALGQASPVVLDGLVITGGNANDSGFVQPFNGFILPGGVKPHEVGGGGIILNSDFVIRNSWVENNAAASRGGFLVYNLNPPTVRKFRAAGVVFHNNLATYGDGGALDIQADSRVASATGQFMVADFVRCVFESNQATTGPDKDSPQDGFPDGGQGGAVCLRRATGNFAGCVFVGNIASGDGIRDNSGNPQAEGGAIYARGNCTLRIANSIFTGNRADREGGAVSMEVGVAGALYFNIFSRNSCTSDQSWGATALGAWYDPGRRDPVNILVGLGNIFWQNIGTGQEISWRADSATPPATQLNGSVTTGGTLANNTGLTRGGDPRFFSPLNPAGEDGIWFTADDGLRIRAGSSALSWANGTRPADFADLDEDGNTTELLPFDAAGVAYPLTPPYNAGAYQTLAP